MEERREYGGQRICGEEERRWRTKNMNSSLLYSVFLGGWGVGVGWGVCRVGYDVELRVGFSLEVGGAINVNLPLLCPDCVIKAIFVQSEIYWAVQFYIE